MGAEDFLVIGYTQKRFRQGKDTQQKTDGNTSDGES